MKNQKISNIRALAILLVVMGHSIILYTGWGVMSTTRSIPYISQVKWIINLIEMPLFMAISGFVFFYSTKKLPNFFKFMWKKVLRVLVPYICIGSFWVAPTRILMNIGEWRKGYFKSIFNNLILLKSNGHLWFLISLFLIFIVAYFAVVIISKLGKECEKFCDIAVLIAFAVLSYVARNSYLITISNKNISRFVMLTFWFWLGYVLNKYLSEEIMAKKAFIPGLMLLLGSIVLVIAYKTKKDKFIYFILQLACVLAFFLIVPNKTCGLTRLLDRDSFGMYLFHSPMIYITFTIFLESNPYFVVLLNFVGLGIISILMTELLRRTPLAFMIGETYKRKEKTGDNK